MKTFEELKYGDIIIMNVSKLNYILGIAFTSTSDEQVLKKCKIEKYWEKDVSVQNSFKIKIVPLDNNYASDTYYVMDFKRIYNKLNNK